MTLNQARNNGLLHFIRPIFLVTALTIFSGVLVFAQDAPWSGQVQCQLAIQNNGYAHQEVQTWTVTGSPTDDGVYPATWSVSGQGGLQRAQGGQVLAGRWTSSVPGMSAPLRIFVRASDGRLVIKGVHSPLVAPGATNVVKQVGASQTNVVYAADEWILPIIEDVGTSINVSGTGTIVVAPTLMPMQPGTSGTATCKWNFTKGANGSKIVPPLGTVPTQNGGDPPAVNTPSPVQSPIVVSSVPRGRSTNTAPNAPPTDPTGFKAQQTDEIHVQLSWNAVPGVATYFVGGPGAGPNGLKVTGTSTTFTNVPDGAQQWTVASWYDPGGLLTNWQSWPTANLNVLGAAGIVCSNGTCACPAGKTVCPLHNPPGEVQSECEDLQTNPDHCGTCSNQCRFHACKTGGSNSQDMRCDSPGLFYMDHFDPAKTNDDFGKCISGTCLATSGDYCTQNSQCQSGGCDLTGPVGACQSANGGACKRDVECLSSLFCNHGSCKTANSLNGIEIDNRITSTKTFTGQLFSDGEADWFWLRCDTPTCAISIQIDYMDAIHVDLFNSNRVPLPIVVVAPPQQVNSQNGQVTYQVKVNGGGITYYYIRVQATTVRTEYNGNVTIPANYILTLSGS